MTLEQLHTFSFPSLIDQNLSLNFGLKSVVSLDLKTFFKLNRKKKKNKEKKKLEEVAAESMAKGSNQEKQNSASEDTRTPAQKAYDKIQEKRVNLLLSLFSYYPLDSCIFFRTNCCKNNSNNNKNDNYNHSNRKKFSVI